MVSPLFIFFLFIITRLSSPHQASTYQPESKSADRSVGQRHFLSFKDTPSGSNRTFECSPSGPCVPCLYSEKIDEKYRCSETGYRIPLKCVESEDVSNVENEKKTRAALEISIDSVKPHVMLHDSEELITSIKHRSLLEDSSTSKGKSQAYITYRSCIPAVNEEKLSVLGFEWLYVIVDAIVRTALGRGLYCVCCLLAVQLYTSEESGLLQCLEWEQGESRLTPDSNLETSGI